MGREPVIRVMVFLLVVCGVLQMHGNGAARVKPAARPAAAIEAWVKANVEKQTNDFGLRVN